MSSDMIEMAIDKLHIWAHQHGLDVGNGARGHEAKKGRITLAYVDASGNTFMSLDASGEFFQLSPRWDPLDVAYDPEPGRWT